MSFSTQQDLTHVESPLQAPAGTGGKFWADDLTWKEALLRTVADLLYEPKITSGATGSFTTVDGKTVTVTKGIITGIV